MGGALSSAGAAEGDVGYAGRSFSGAGSEASGSKPESKLWWNDGAWWSSMWDTVSGDYHIFRLDGLTQKWVDTGVPLDTRSNTRADTLWDGTYLYVASHVYNTSTSSGYPARLFRFSYDTVRDTYVPDAGYPATINNYRTETLVIDKDATGRLWATWVQGTSVYITHTLADDRTWAAPFVLPATGATALKSDDISTLVSFGGGKVGVMWSNQTTATIRFAVHLDGMPPTVWQPAESALSGSKMADDHLNLKADRDGRVYAAIRTSQTTSTLPLTMLLVRGPAGGWSSSVFGTVADKHGRAIVLLDEAAGQIHMLAASSESGGTVYEKTTPKNAIAFPPGLGTPFIRNIAAASMNNPTSTKQNVNGETDLAVLAGHGGTSLYWHNWLTLPDVEAPALGADFVTAPTSGFAPVATQFDDRSTGTPVGWAWDFGDGTGSTEPNPAHTYARTGSYTVSLTVTNEAGGTSTRVRTAYVDVVPVTPEFTGAPLSGRVPLSVKFTDATTGVPVRYQWDFGDGTGSTEKSPTHLYAFAGTYTVTLTVWDGADNASTRTRTAYVTALPLTAEFTGTPTSGGAPLVVRYTDATLGTPIRWSWDFGDGTSSEERSPTHTYSSPGTYTVVLTVWDAAGNVSTRTRAGYVTAHPVTADFVGTPAAGPAPLLVSFSDRSLGTPTTWLWEFGDRQTSTVRNPAHTYKRPGRYTVKLTVSDARGDTSTKTATDYVVASPDTTLTPSADGYVRSSYQTNSYGTASTLRVKYGGTAENYRSYLKFTVPQLAGPVVGAKLRLFVADSSTAGGDVYSVDGSWTEPSLTWSSSPPMSGSPLGTLGNAPSNTWLTLTLPASMFAAGSGAYALGIQQPASASEVWYTSREGTAANRPQLILTVDFGPDNAPPVPVADSATTDEDADVVVDVLANDAPGPPEEAAQHLVVDAITTGPAHGTVQVEADGRIRYLPSADYNGADRFTYRVCDDGDGRLCSSAAVDLMVLPVNDSPRLLDDAVSVDEDSSGATAVLANDAGGPPDEAGQSLSLTEIASAPGHGTAHVDGGTIVYTPAGDYYGPDELTYKACDDGAASLCSTAKVVYDVDGVNDTPLPAADVITTGEDEEVAPDLLGNDAAGPANESGQQLHVDRIESQPEHGIVLIDTDGSVRYLPGADFFGSDGFSYRVCDDAIPSLCATAAVQVEITSRNDEPDAGTDSISLVEDTSAFTEVLGNDGPGAPDEIGQSLSVVGIEQAPQHGTADFDATEVLYVADPDFSGTDVVLYRVCDDGEPAACSSGRVEITVSPVNDPPKAVDDQFPLASGQEQQLDVLANDAGGPGSEAGEPVELMAVTVFPAHGEAEVVDAAVRYEDSSTYYQADTFVYQVCDYETPRLCATARATTDTAVVPVGETDPVPHAGDAADDPAIWVDQDDPARSAVIGTDKLGGIAVYDLAGNELQYRGGARMNNVDLRPGFVLGGEPTTLVAASQRSSGIATFRLNPVTRNIEPVEARELETGVSPYGLCLYKSAASEKLYAFVTRRYEPEDPPDANDVEQWELFDDGTGKVDARLVRSFRVGSQTEGCVADDDLGALYLAEEDVGIWRYDAEPDAGTDRTLVDSTGPSGQLDRDVEGLAIAYGAGGSGYLVASSQGDDLFSVYGREDNEHIRSFRIRGVEHADGIDATSATLGEAFPGGLLVVHDGLNGVDNQNYKLVRLEEVIGEEPDTPDCTRPYAADSPWNTPIGAVPAYDAQSEFYLTSIQGTLSSNPEEYTFPVYEIGVNTPRATVPLDGWFSQVGGGGSFLTNQRAGTVDFPIPPGAGPAAGDDAQVIMVDPLTGDEWGASSLTPDLAGGWTAWNAYLYNTAWSGVPPRDASERPFFPRGAGVPYLAGLVRPCEIARGRIDHALAFAYDYPLDAYVYPATKSDGNGLDPNDLPEGARLQLDPSLTEAEIRSWGCTGPCMTVAKALQTYGMYLIDNSGRPKIMFEFEGTAKWDSRIEAHSVRAIPISALKLLELGPITPD